MDDFLAQEGCQQREVNRLVKVLVCDYCPDSSLLATEDSGMAALDWALLTLWDPPSATLEAFVEGPGGAGRCGPGDVRRSG